MKTNPVISGILLATLLAGCCTPRDRTSAAVEYRVEWLASGDMQQRLNTLAQEGWVVVTSYQMDSSLREVILSRQKK
ncbi:MAG: hypothetical protein KJ072_27915 [Verrucomicrobia bacterium]|nr:hypothetical protein [Verrucomicrobiota bacterium]